VAPVLIPSVPPARAQVPPAGETARRGGPAVDPDRAYAGAMAAVRAGEYGQAVLELSEFVAKFPGHREAPSAQWWIGESYYRERDFRQAIVELQRVVDAYPKSSRAPDALMRIASCHERLGDAARARATRERVVREHQGTEAATQARGLLASRVSERSAR
jgi:tol-pal system protein YbgF